jgi:hypothetical protein
LFVRRLFPSLICVAFAATLHASVPAARQTQFMSPSADMRLEQARTSRALPLTAAPADRQSFVAEFYFAGPLHARTERKTGILKRFTTLVRKTAQKVNFFE